MELIITTYHCLGCLSISKHYIPCPSTWPPFLSTQRLARFDISRTALRIIGTWWRRASNSSMILCRRVAMSGGGGNKHFALENNPKEKSHNKSDPEIAVATPHHDTRQSLDVQIPQPICFLLLTSRWAGAPSCAHHRRLNTPLCCIGKFSINSGITCSFKICKYPFPFMLYWKKKGPRSTCSYE